MPRKRRSSRNRAGFLLFVLVLSIAAAFAFGTGQSIGDAIIASQDHHVSQFEMVMESRQMNPPESRNGNTLPTWSIILGFIVAAVFILRQGSNLLESANKLARSLKRKKREQRSVTPSPWRVEPNPTPSLPAPGRPLTAVSPLLEAPRERNATSGNGSNDSIDDVGWA
jgi:hypothetical protein